jgi:hypothetical protein
MIISNSEYTQSLKSQNLSSQSLSWNSQTLSSPNIRSQSLSSQNLSFQNLSSQNLSCSTTYTSRNTTVGQCLMPPLSLLILMNERKKLGSKAYEDVSICYHMRSNEKLKFEFRSQKKLQHRESGLKFLL